MPEQVIWVGSVEYVRVGVSVADGTNPTSFTVEFAFEPPSEGNPEPGDFSAGEWEAGGPPYVARFLTDPVALGLLAGIYVVWILIDAGAEEPMKPACVIEICGEVGS